MTILSASCSLFPVPKFFIALRCVINEYTRFLAGAQAESCFGVPADDRDDTEADDEEEDEEEAPSI
jgi:hypothetical protein